MNIQLLRQFVIALSLMTASLEAGITPPQASVEIDKLLAAYWKSAGVQGASLVTDEIFLRRIYLDLAGRIPTGEEARAFLASPQQDKRSALIDELLVRESYVSNFYNFWADILRVKSRFVNTANVVPPAYAKFIKESLRSNKPYDQFVREMLSAKGYAWENGAVGYYLRDPEMPLDNMAITSRVFLGTRIECAQCHNHPFDKWKQTDFYHVAAYTYGNKPISETLGGVRDAFKAREQAILQDFNQEKAASKDDGKAAEQRKEERMVAIEFRPVLNLIRHGIGQLFSPIGLDRKADAVLKLPSDFHQEDGQPGDIIQPRPLYGQLAESGPAGDREEAFAHWVTSSENPSFTRVIVNRLWKKLYGVALIEPLDELRDDTKPSVPELEAYLEKLMVELKYDMRAFLAVVARTRAYQSAAPAEEFSREHPWNFQGPALRRMTAEQIWDSMVALASYEPDARDLAREAREQRSIDISHMAADAYLNYDGEKIVELGYANLANEKAILAKERVIHEAEVEANRHGDKDQVTALRRALGLLERERNQAYVREFLTPLLANLARLKTGSETNISIDETYKMNPNPAVFAVETWRTKYIPGYGAAPKSAAQVEAEKGVEKQRLNDLAAKLGYEETDRPGFVSYGERSRAEWLRASELESPAPRGHFLRTLGQSDRDFVENANPNASIPQALALMNSDLLSPRALLSPYSPLMHAVNQAPTAAGQRDAVYLALLSRLPSPTEKSALETASAHGLGSPVGLIYTLLNTKQFLFIQ